MVITPSTHVVAALQLGRLAYCNHILSPVRRRDGAMEKAVKSKTLTCLHDFSISGSQWGNT